MLKIEIRWSETGDITESEFQIKSFKDRNAAIMWFRRNYKHIVYFNGIYTNCNRVPDFTLDLREV